MPRRSSQVRQVELVDAALHVIATRGIAALTTRSLAEEVGLTTGAIFRHFATLDALLVAVVARVEAVLEASYPDPALPPLERLSRFVDARTRTVGDLVGILRLVVSEQFLLSLPDRGSERLAACVHKSRVFVVTCLREAQAGGAIRADIAAEVLAPVVMGTMQMLVLSRSSSSKSASEADRIRDGLFALLRAPAAKPARKRRSS